MEGLLLFSSAANGLNGFVWMAGGMQGGCEVEGEGREGCEVVEGEGRADGEGLERASEAKGLLLVDESGGAGGMGAGLWLFTPT